MTRQLITQESLPGKTIKQVIKKRCELVLMFQDDTFVVFDSCHGGTTQYGSGDVHVSSCFLSNEKLEELGLITKVQRIFDNLTNVERDEMRRLLT